MFTDLCSNISTFSPDLLLRVLTFTMRTHKSTSLLCRWCSYCMTIWKGLHLPLVLLCERYLHFQSSPIQLQFQSHLQSLYYQYFFPFHKFKCGNILWLSTLSDTNPAMWWGPMLSSSHYPKVIANQGRRAVRLPMR